ncbi:MAG: hypothetical protein ACLS4Z_04465 [Christensenellaceae bacterium]
MNQEISDLLAYAALHLGMESADATYLANRLIEKLGLDGFSPYETDKKRIAALDCPDEVILPVLAYAKEKDLSRRARRNFTSNPRYAFPRPSEGKTVSRNMTKARQAFDGLYSWASKTITSSWPFVKINSGLRRRRETRLKLPQSGQA